MSDATGSGTGLTICRFLFLLGLAVWLGGLAFVAVGAPAMFRVDRSLGPQMVGAALGNFTPVTYICAFLVFAGWMGERLLRAARGRDRAWTAQGVCIGAMIVIAIYLGTTVMPEMVALQPEVVAQPSGAASASTVSERFAEMHRTYRTMTSTIVFFGLTTLFLFCSRISRPPSLEEEKAALREGSIFTRGAI